MQRTTNVAAGDASGMTRMRGATRSTSLSNGREGRAIWRDTGPCLRMWEVSEFHIGRYQVVKKWLSYREKSMLRRGLRVEEAEYVTEMVRRVGGGEADGRRGGSDGIRRERESALCKGT